MAVVVPTGSPVKTTLFSRSLAGYQVADAFVNGTARRSQRSQIHLRRRPAEWTIYKVWRQAPVGPHRPGGRQARGHRERHGTVPRASHVMLAIVQATGLRS